MKRHSILTTIFPRLGFNNHCIQSLKKQYDLDGKPTGERYRLNPGISDLVLHAKPEKDFAWVPDLFAPISLRDDLDVTTHLFYHEVRETSSAKHKSLFKKATSFAKVVSCLKFIRDGKRELVSRIQDRERLFDLFCDLLEDPCVTRISFELHIYVSGKALVQLTENLDEDQNIHRNAARKEWLAQELTTGYRRFVNQFLVLLYAQAYMNKAKRHQSEAVGLLNIARKSSMKPESLDDDHSTVEDGWRLICCFHSIQTVAKAMNREHWKTPVLSVDDFVQSLVKPNKDGGMAMRIIDELFRKKYIKREIALKKCLEYYIYEGIPSLPVAS